MTREIDPVVLEVIRHELLSVADEMNIVMRLTTRSVAAKELNDFSSALLDSAGTVVAQAVPYGLRVFAGAVPFVIEKFAGRFQAGDVLLANDPYRGASHLPDILVVMPIFFHHDVIGFAATYQHHTDIGGRFPGGFGTESREIYEEGLRLPIVHLYREGRLEVGVRDIIAANVRSPEDVLGDLEANVAACRRGVRGMIELAEKHGPETARACCAALVTASARYVEDVIRSIPDGRYRAEGNVDSGSGTRFGLVATLIVEGSSFTVDLTGSSPQVDTAWNLPPGLASGAALRTVLGLLPHPELVINGGLVKNIHLIAPPGTVVNPLFPAAVASRAQAQMVLSDLILEALTSAIPGRVPAAGDGGPTVFMFTGHRNDGTAPRVFTDIWFGGWGARSTSDGIDGVVGLSSNGFRTSSAELVELQSPVAIDGFGYVPDTGGAGEFRGTVSLFRRFRVSQSGRVMLRTCRSNAVASGLAGGGEGGPFSAKLNRDGVETLLPRQSVLDLQVSAGDVIEHTTPGGGGYGNPLKRNPERVLADVLDDKVSAVCAEDVYGVALSTDTKTIDRQRTAALRERRLRTE